MTFSEKFGISTLFLMLAVVSAAMLTSANHYLVVTEFNLLDARQGERVMLDYERTIKRDFEASWRVDLYRENVWVLTAESPRVHTYRTTAKLPPKDALDLGWIAYTNPDFENLSCGRYEAVVRWAINPDSVVMRRLVEARDKFQVVCE